MCLIDLYTRNMFTSTIPFFTDSVRNIFSIQQVVTRTPGPDHMAKTGPLGILIKMAAWNIKDWIEIRLQDLHFVYSQISQCFYGYNMSHKHQYKHTKYMISIHIKHVYVSPANNWVGNWLWLLSLLAVHQIPWLHHLCSSASYAYSPIISTQCYYYFIPSHKIPTFR